MAGMTVYDPCFSSSVIIWMAEKVNLIFFVCTVFLLLLYIATCFMARRPCYLIDFACLKYGENDKVTLEIVEHYMKRDNNDERNMLFQLKVFLKSGIGEETYLPRSILEKKENLSLRDLCNQAESLIVRVLAELLAKTLLNPLEVDIVIVNCGVFSTAPSLAAWLVNRFKMRSDVKAFCFAGMGCSAGLLGIDLARDLLQVYANKYAVVVSTELMMAMYSGRERAMMVTNCLFRSGASAVLLSNRSHEKKRAKFRLLHSLRWNSASDNEAYGCVSVLEDEDGKMGFRLNASLLTAAGDTLRANIERLAPRVLPLSELLKVLLNRMQKALMKRKVKTYVPNFKAAFDHFCLHPGGRAVIDSIGQNMGLDDYDLEPSRMTLHRFGNTSSSGVWYVLAYCEAKNRLKKGDRVWQVGLGSGFKCISSVWKVLQDSDPKATSNAWSDSIHRYPVYEQPENLPHLQTFIHALKINSVKRER
eukprot:c12778_g1_i1 orf=452-1876(+)